MANKRIVGSKFLEEYPLYRKLNTLDVSDKRYGDISTLSQLEVVMPSAHMECPICESDQTYTIIILERGLRDYGPTIDDKTFLLTYICAGCEIHKRHFIIKFSDGHKLIEKIGQYPPWDISIDKTTKSMLGDYVELFKNGKICESQSYGIGAYAYYRRVVEYVIDDLIDEIYNLLTTEDKKKFEDVYKKIKCSKRADEKIDLAKDILPLSLRSGGINPLNIIYDALSIGIHAKTDEECLEVSEDIRKMLVILFERISHETRSSQELAEIAKKLMDKKSKTES